MTFENCDNKFTDLILNRDEVFLIVTAVIHNTMAEVLVTKSIIRRKLKACQASGKLFRTQIFLYCWSPQCIKVEDILTYDVLQVLFLKRVIPENIWIIMKFTRIKSRIIVHVWEKSKNICVRPSIITSNLTPSRQFLCLNSNSFCPYCRVHRFQAYKCYVIQRRSQMTTVFCVHAL